MTKIIPVLQGGLGNQLFIYSAARRLALQTGSELVLDNKSGFERDSRYKRTYALQHFLPHARVVAPHERINSMGGFYRYYLRLMSFLTPNKLGSLLVEKRPDFDPRILSLRPEKDILYMEGYWQSANYFEDIESVIRSDLQQKPDIDSINKTYFESIKQQNSTAIHVRFFNDYADENAEMKQYYMRAFQYVEKVRPNSCYYFFGEDADIIKSIIDLPKDRIKVISHNRGDTGAYLDLFLMRHCKNLIIAKSTFSWWAAWLSERKDKLVIAPKAIKNTGESIWASKGMLPNEWIKL